MARGHAFNRKHPRNKDGTFKHKKHAHKKKRKASRRRRRSSSSAW